ncbi:hypothetical protein [Ligilactobacillus salivarius]|uniref:Uncharacterized protein n=1 Tax=Ligilactobacillus salivarius (strain UCC118) TaxID=362948 RepID=A0JQB7_LIGS1|nr:hypothetical protein [Ligilactobacillus salivarius]ABD99067.1 Hypothetical protein, phage associated [Ligilactobacillus salivarius UCC118]
MIVTATYKYDLSDDDIERIAERVVRKLEINSNKQKQLNTVVYLHKHFGDGEKGIKIFRISN